jgi:hypothetical protein
MGGVFELLASQQFRNGENSQPRIAAWKTFGFIEAARHGEQSPHPADWPPSRCEGERAFATGDCG